MLLGGYFKANSHSYLEEIKIKIMLIYSLTTSFVLILDSSPFSFGVSMYLSDTSLAKALRIFRSPPPPPATIYSF